MTIAAGRKARDDGMRRVSDPTWSREYRAAMYALVEFKGIGEDFRHKMLERGLREPAHHNAWGANFHAAICAGVIELTDDEPRQMSDPKANARGHNRVYRLVAGDLM